MKSTSSGMNGFSLVEAIVALAIVALLASLASESFRYAARTRANITEMAVQFEESETLRRVIDRSISSTQPFDSDPQTKTAALQGSSTELTFTAPLPDSIFRGAPGDYRLALTKNGELVLAWRIAATDVVGDGYSGVVTLATDVAEVSIEYFGPLSPYRSDWMSSWTRTSLPQLVKFRWRRGNDTQQTVIRLPAARADCFPSNITFPRDCLE